MIYIAIPVHNRKTILRDCLRSLYNQDNLDFKIIVTDDGSTDGTEMMLKSEFPDVILEKGNGNLWWTGAINKAVKRALEICNDDDHILILNDDLIVPENYITNFYNLAKTHPNSLIGSVVTDINDRDKIFSGGVLMNWLTAKIKDINQGKSLTSFGTGYFVEVSYLTGRGVLIPSKVFRDLGLYNNYHYQQCGDTELPRRAYKSGYKLIVSYDVPVYSYVKEEGHINHLTNFSFKNFKKYFLDVRSNMNLKYRFWFAYDSASNILQGTIFFVFDLARITGHFVKKLR